MTGMMSSYVFTTPYALRPSDLPAAEVFVENQQVVRNHAANCYKIQIGMAPSISYYNM